MISTNHFLTHFRIKECEYELTQKGDMVARLQVKASQIGKILQSLENQNRAADEKQHKKASSQGQSSKMKSDGPPQKKSHHIDPIPPFNANKIRKSPSMITPTEANPPTSIASASTPVAETPTDESVDAPI